MSFHALSFFSLLFTSIFKSQCSTIVKDALSNLGWRKAMEAEMDVHHNGETRDLVPLPMGKPSNGCKWLYMVIFTLDDSMGSLNKYLLLRILSTCLWHYEEAFFLVAKITSIRLMIFLWLILTNHYFNWTLKKLVYMVTYLKRCSYGLPLG